MIMKHIVNGIELDMTQTELDDYNQRQQEWVTNEPQRLKNEFIQALEKAINDKAGEKSYSSGISCATYKDSTNVQWASEAQAFIEWRDHCYEYAYDYLARYENEEILNPTLEDFISELPTITWP